MGDTQDLYSHLDWSDLAIFLAVAKHGSMNKASTVLNKTQVTIRNRISYLEDRLQSKLFIRGSTGMILTDVGQAILNRAEAMEVQARQIGEIAHGRRRDEAVQVSLEVPDGIGSYWITRFLPDFQDNHPNFKLTLNTIGKGNEEEIPETDMAIRFEQTRSPDYVAARLGKVHYVPITTRAYLDKHGTPGTMIEMLEHRVLNLHSYGQQKDKWSQRNSAYHDLSQAKFNTNSSSLLVESVKAGLGICMLPTYGLVSTPGLVVLDFGIVISLDFWMMYHKDAPAFDRIERTIGWCREIMSPEKYPCFRDEFVQPDTFADVEIIRH